MQYNGLVNYSEQYKEIKWSNRNGWTETRTFDGIYEALNNLGNSIKANDQNIVDINLSQPSPEGYAQLIVTYAIDKPITWSFVSNLIETDLKFHPTIVSFREGLAGATVEVKNARFNCLMMAIDEAYNYGWEYSYMLANSTVPAFAAVYATLITEEVAEFKLIFAEFMKGINHYPCSQLVLRKQSLISGYNSTLSLSTIADVPLLIAQTNKQYTKAGLIYYFSSTDISNYSYIPIWISAQMPAAGHWWYQTPHITQLNNGKLEISQEWWWNANFSTFIFGAAIDAPIP